KLDIDSQDNFAVQYDQMGALSEKKRAGGSALKLRFLFLGFLMNLEDIARKAGVSRATVSRVINHAHNVSPKTRELVWEVIRKETFQPDPAARALVRRRTEIIGVVIPSSGNIFFTDNNYFTQILAGVSQETRARDYALLLWLLEMTDVNDTFMQKIFNNRPMDRMIIASMSHEHPPFKRLLKLHTPLLLIQRPLRQNDTI